MNKSKLFIFTLLTVLLTSFVGYGEETKAERDARMAWWREAKFGMFIHWGVYSVPAGFYHDQPIGGIGEWIMNTGKIPMAEYQGFAKEFNPVKFNAEEWVKIAKDAGQKYIVITSKHHDGFAMFDTKASPWNIMQASPYHRDPLKELAAACKKYDIKLGFYYSQAQDWNNGGSAAGGKWDPAQQHDMDDYIDKIAVPQVKEILSNYGSFPACLWWDTDIDMNPARAKKLYDVVEKLRPNIIMNNRLGGGYKGDTETPEQYIPAQGYPGRDWETCMTMNDTWGFKRDDQNFKSTEMLIRNMCDIASKGGNYLLNVGPTSEGLIPQAEIDRLREVGAWMKVNGEAIYGTSPTPFGAEAGSFSATEKDRNGKPKFIAAWDWRATAKAGKIYIHIFNWPKDGQFKLASLQSRVNKAYLLADHKNRAVVQSDNGVIIGLPENAPDKIASVLVLEIADKTVKLASAVPIAPGKYSGNLNSLADYSCPDWFRDAKFGIWAHWGPQAVPMEGDWYARKMYEQGSADYKDHLARFGHPSTNGWKDIIPLWKAEKWEPEKLIELYKQAGAKYFVSMGTHHDDFFLWNSPLHKWNAANYGPHRDVVAEWQKAAKKNGLPFGVSEHLGASFTWFQDAHKSDKTGPLAGVPYDGASPENWDLYHFPAEAGDTQWYSNNPRWQHQWYNEIKELVDNYKPDLLYSDGGVAFGNEIGLSAIANLYNVSAAAHGGKNEAVYNCKQPSDGLWVQDYERGVNGGINPHPWQTDTSIGDWFYNRHWKYQPLSWTVTMLVDIVSKNGNLLLNVVLRPDGSLDPEVETMLHQLADWTKVNGEAIYGSRPWQVYGEGPVQAKGGAFKENFNFTAKDIRFTTKGKTLYAIALGWPAEKTLLIRSLAKTNDARQNEIKRVELLGYKGKLKFTQSAEGLLVELPEQKISDLTCSLKITGNHLQAVAKPAPPALIQADAKGNVILAATDAQLHGSQLQLEEQGGLPDIGFWNNGGDSVSWTVRIAKPGAYKVSAKIAAQDAGAPFIVEVAGERIIGQPPQTGGWDKFQSMDLGEIKIQKIGELSVKVRAKDATSWKPMNLNSVQLAPVD